MIRGQWRVACVNLEDLLKSGEHKDIDGHGLFGGVNFCPEFT